MGHVRVLHIVSAMNRGGTETLLMNVYRNIDKTKIQFDFISHRNETCDYDNEIESLGGKIYRIASLGQQGPLAYIRELQKIMKTNRYAAVHSHTDYQSGFPALAAKLAGVKLRICHSHSNHQNKGLKDKLVFKALQAVIQYAATDYCACSKEAARSLFGEKKVIKDQVHILKNGIEIGEFINVDENQSVREELSIPNTMKIIGHVGNFSATKNQIFILKVLKILLDQDRNIVAVLVGDGPLRTSIEEESKKLGVYDHLRFLGVRADIARLMTSLDVFLFPSLYEGFGIVALEAQCAGTPCVASDTVPKTTDMGLNLISYLSLNEDLSVWVNKINEAFLLSRPDYHVISQHFLKKGFAIRESVPQWLSLYGIS
jgi:glycosyltransferase EpsF